MDNTTDFVAHAKQLLGDQEFAAIEKQAHLEAENYLRLNQSIAESVQKYMAEQQLGFNDLSKQFGLSPTQMSKIVKGEGNFTLSTIAHVFSMMGRRLQLVAV